MLRSPIRLLLREGIDERAIARIWRGVLARRQHFGASWRSLLAMGMLGASIALLALWVVQVAQGFSAQPPKSGRGNRPSGAAQSTNSLTFADGTPLRIAQVGAADEQMTWPLSDGSQLTLYPGARWEPLASSSTEFASSVREGSVEFRVKPGGARRWLIHAGPVSVEVVGTQFVVARALKSVIVSVHSGAVLVRGEPVPDKVQRLSGGQSLEVHLATEEKVAEAAAARTGDAPPHPPGWLTRARQGDFSGAYADLGPNGLEREAAETREPGRLLTLADIARLSGHPGDAVAPLRQIVEQHPTQPEAGLAAVTLGRVQLDQLGRPADAARVLEKALGMNVPQGLREDVYSRLIQAHVRAGNRTLARQVLERYEREFPTARRREEARRLLEAP